MGKHVKINVMPCFQSLEHWFLLMGVDGAQRSWRFHSNAANGSLGVCVCARACAGGWNPQCPHH